jgi:hypothetical protein
MKRNIIGFLATPLIAPFVILLIAISHMNIASENYLEYKVFTDPKFQLFFTVVVFLVLALSIPVFFYFRKYGYVLMRHFLMLGSMWGVIPSLLIASKFIRFEGFFYGLEMLVLAAGTGAALFLIYWLLAVRKNAWWRNK